MFSQFIHRYSFNDSDCFVRCLPLHSSVTDFSFLIYFLIHFQCNFPQWIDYLFALNAFNVMNKQLFSIFNYLFFICKVNKNHLDSNENVHFIVSCKRNALHFLWIYFHTFFSSAVLDIGYFSIICCIFFFLLL